MSERLRWGILSTGNIADKFARALAHSEHGRLVAVGSRNAVTAARFAEAHGAPRAHATYEDLLADPEVQAVYIGTPHPLHVAWIIRAAEAGKHVLCEKPLGLNQAEAMVAIEACRRHDVLLMEGFAYRFHPQTARMLTLIREGALGTVRHVEGAFAFVLPFAPGLRFWSQELAGGSLLDLGCYPVSLARLVAGAVAGQPFANPVQVSGVVHPEPRTGVDAHAAATMKFADGLTATVACGLDRTQDNSVRIHGDEAWLHLPLPWSPHREGGMTTMYLHRAGWGAPEEIRVENDRWLFALEADGFATALAAGRRDVPEMSRADTLGNLAALDAWRASAGHVYAAETPAGFQHTHARRPLARHPGAAMPQAPVPGLERPLARLVMGCDNQRTMPQAAAMWDDWFEHGGNTFDTAWIYGDGLMETLLGHWLRHRGVRDEVVLIGKGAHAPCCTPEWIARQLDESLQRLQTDRVEVYLLHRDNPAVPVGEFVDALHAEVRAGRIKVFGGSNWTPARVQAANRYARRKGLQEFSVLSNQLSLARMVEAPWAGCLSAGDANTRRWLKKTQLPLLAWSCQSRGFFGERAAPDRTENADLVRCWYAEDNWQRRERAAQLAVRHDVPLVAIAVAYVLHQAFPTFAVVGPRTLEQSRTTRQAVGITLTPREVAWLNLERDRP